MVNYYTLEEAARLLGLAPEEVKKLVERNELRAFRDRGNLRFRSQDIDERARQLGRGSDPDLQPGDALRPRASDSPAPRRPDPDDQVELGSEARPASGSKSGSGRKGSKLGPATPPPKSGSDSDVRLVPDGSQVDFKIGSDSDVKMVAEPPAPPRKSQVKRPTGQHIDPQQDSGVRIVPLEGDSDVKVVPDTGDDATVSFGAEPRSASDSDIRLHEDPSSKRQGGPGKRKSKVEPPVTEEIDLDAELRQAGTPEPSRKVRGQGLGGRPALPTGSPFELSDSDLEKPAGARNIGDSSSDFDLDLSPVGEDQSPIDLESDEEVSLGDLGSPERASGINLQDPADSGISLEKGAASDIDLELDAGATPRPARPADRDSSSEFELTLDAEDTPKPRKAAAPAGEDEFELSLDADESPSQVESTSSEFELTLDDSGLAPLDEEEAGEKDIFETDFEVPALDEESGSQAVALDEGDTDLESSDFELATGEEEETADEESGSQVMAIDEEEGVAPVTRTRRRAALDEDEEAEEERAGRAAVAAAPAQWGVMPALVMFPCVLVMFLVGLMGFELVRGMWGYHQPYKVSSLIVRPLAEMFTDDLPK